VAHLSFSPFFTNSNVTTWSKNTINISKVSRYFAIIFQNDEKWVKSAYGMTQKEKIRPHLT